MKITILAALLTLTCAVSAQAQVIYTQDLSQFDLVGSGVMPAATVVLTNVAITVSGSVAGPITNTARKRLIINNNAANALLVGYSAVLVTSTPNMVIPASTTYDSGGGAVYNGPLSFGRIGNSGNVQVTELQR